ncbi:hypothetical protein LTR22_016266 [Elasticomyces elasticus]|nr:hypothetical protein LTR22_016266 [Elasticomyces elasticus]KAK4914193.1 hypothetical protein LTR49_017546 [Elasticomyces elasticus]KAK5762554.1 hypothetical protein LTS12_007345 [Elasticomyces elasticus]
MAKVFAIPELLEGVLLQLPFIDLLLSQRVCRAWHIAVTSSTKIQKALFLTPGTKDDVTPYEESKSGQTYCCVLDEVFRGCSSFTLNPLLKATNGKSNMHEVKLLLKHTFSNSCAEASCHRMLLTQPPTRIELCYDSRYFEPGPANEGMGRFGTENLCIQATTIGELAQQRERRLRKLAVTAVVDDSGKIGRWWSEHGVDSEHDACAARSVDDAHLLGSSWYSDGGL